MEKTLSSQATNWKEGRRLRAWELYQEGWKQRDIANALGVTQGAVSQWLKRGREGGVESLRHQPPPGATPRLSPVQRDELLQLLSQGAEFFGFQGDVWTQPIGHPDSRPLWGVIRSFPRRPYSEGLWLE